jgi:hypothetical protein
MAKQLADGRIQIEKGDTLYSIYGPNWKQLSGYAGDPTKLQIGTVLPSPSGSKPNASAPAANPTAPVNPLQQVNQTIQDSFQKLQDEVVKKFGEYKSGKPFNVDEVLADKTKQAKEQIDPYYDQILGDYLLGVTRKINRGADDTRDLLSELSASTDSYTASARNTLEDATAKAEQGFADAGLTGSGDALRTEGQLKQDTGANIADYTRKSDLQAKRLTDANGRNIEDVNLQKAGYLSDLERNRFTDTSTRASQLTKEAGQQYIQGFQSVLPTSLQSASGFDMLKSLGIYS